MLRGSTFSKYNLTPASSAYFVDYTANSLRRSEHEEDADSPTPHPPSLPSLAKGSFLALALRREPKARYDLISAFNPSPMRQVSFRCSRSD